MRLISRCGIRLSGASGTSRRAILAAAAGGLVLEAVILCVQSPNAQGEDFGG